jgi:hypothetical protein
MLLHGDGSAGVPSTGSGAGASTTVTNFNADASTNNFNVTINGDARSDNFTPYQGTGYYSNNFASSSTDYLSAASNAAFAFGTGDFTMEAFVFATASQTDNWIIGLASNCWFRVGSGGALEFYNSVASTSTLASTALPLNTWTHVAVVRSGTALTIYQNGVSVGTATVSTNFSSSVACTIGNQVGFDRRFNGYISNARVVKGTAVYTAAFTPSTTPLTAISGTSLLTCQNNRFIDNSTNAFTLTVSGTPTVSPAIPFTLPTTVATYGSGYFDGTTDYLTAPAANIVNFGTGDFEVAAWFNCSSTAAARKIVDNYNGTPNPNIALVVNFNGAGVISWYSGQTALINSSSTFAPNTWNYVVVSRVSGTTRMFLNGTQVGSVSDSNNYAVGFTTVGIGGEPYSSGGTSFLGYLTDVRIVKGSGITSSTIPTTPLTAITNTQLLTTQYNGGGNNSGFKDSSQNNFVITRNGNTTQGTFTPYGSNWSNYFDGDGDGITSAVSAGFAFGTGDFTYEAWYYSLETGSNPRGMFDTRVSSSSTAGVLMREDSSGFLVYINGATLFTATGRVANTWQHIALVRNSGTIRLYVNGVQANSASSSQNFTDPNCRISGFIDTQATPYGYFGYISNARVVKGTCLYPSGTTFTPSITPLTAISGTSLLTCQGNRFFDASSNALAITVNGSPSVQRFSPFAPLTVYNPTTYGGSMYLDGTGDYLGVTGATTALAFGSGDFTIELWAYILQTTPEQMLIDWRPAGTQTTQPLIYVTSAGVLAYYVSAANRITGATLVANQWYHIAVSRSGTSTKMFLNGVQTGSTYTDTTVYTNTSTRPLIGLDGNTTSSGYLKGNVTDVRTLTGTALYTTTFTPPTSPLTAVTGTSLLLSTTNPAILDNAMLNNLETVGNAQISTSVKKYGAASMYFDGTGDALYSTSQSPTFLTGDFTLEFWIYFNAVNNSTVKYIYDMRNSGATSASFLAQESSNAWTFWNGAGSTLSTGFTGSTFSATTWTHVAICRSSGTTKFFVNGTQTGSVADTSSYANSTLTVGTRYSYSDGFNGYIDDLRITKAARYTTTFTVPDQAFPNG